MLKNNLSRTKGKITPEELSRIKDLYLLAREVVEGFVAGHHKSPFKGFSLEFAEHRKYVPGDEIKHLDWKVFGRTGKHYVRLYEAETDMRVITVLDTSNSMSFQYANSIDKLTYSTLLAAAISYLVSKQQDMIGFASFSNELHNYIPPKSSSNHVRYIISHLSDINSSGNTEIYNSFEKLITRLNKRCLIVLFSDLFDNHEQIKSSLKLLRSRHHEVIVFHVLDNAELSFPFSSKSTFIDSETGQKLTTDPLAIRKEYLEAISTFRDTMKKSLALLGVDFIPVNTMMPIEHILTNYLSSRKKLKA